MPVRPQYLTLFVALAAIALVIGALGLLDLRNVPYAGYFANRNNEVTVVFPESPAARAGLEVGDVVQSIGGISIEDISALSRRPRPEIGETRTFEVQRGSETRELDVTYGGQPTRNHVTALLATVVALCFLGFGLWAYSRAPSTATLTLALLGLCFGSAFLPAPYSKSFFMRSLGGALGTTLVVIGFAFLIHFLLLFPKRRALLDKPWAGKLIYIPAIFVALFFLFLTVAQPDFTGGLRLFTGLLVGLFIVGYFGWSLVTMLQSFKRATPEERSRHGVTLMLVGTLLALLPVTVSNLVVTLAPSVTLPGFQYYGLTLGLIPVTFALAAVRKASAAG